MPPIRRVIRWTEVERATVIKEAVRLSDSNLHLSKSELLHHAINAIPKDRRRPENAQVVAWLSDEVRRAKLIIAQNVTAVTNHSSDIPAVPITTDVVARAVADTVAQVIRMVLEHEDVRTAARALVNDAMGKPLPINDSNRWTAVDRGKKVLVAGLIGHQVEEINKSFGDKLSLRFWVSGHSMDRLKQLSKESDTVIGMTGFISHPADASMKSNAGDRYIRHPGGITGLKSLLAGVGN